jgi:hypothetical protein
VPGDRPPEGPFQEHAEEVLPLWTDVASIIGASKQPELIDVARDMHRRIAEGAEGELSESQRRALLAEEVQLTQYLMHRYEGFADLEAPLRQIHSSTRQLTGEQYGGPPEPGPGSAAPP